MLIKDLLESHRVTAKLRARWVERTLFFAAIVVVPMIGTAQVAFRTASFAYVLRSEGLTEAIGPVVLTSNAVGLIKAGSSITVSYDATIVNLSSTTSNNLALSCSNGATGCGSTITVSPLSTDGHTLTIQFSADTSVPAGAALSINQLRVNMTTATAHGNIFLATLLATSSAPTTNAISLTNASLQLGLINSSALTNVLFGAANPIQTCAVTPKTFFVRGTERFPGALSSAADESNVTPAFPIANGTVLNVKLAGVPSGMAVAYTSFSGTSGLSISAPATTAITSTGADIVFSLPISSLNDGSIRSFIVTFTVGLPGPGSTIIGGSLTPLGTVVTPTATVSIGPNLGTSNVISFAPNTQGYGFVFEVGDCGAPGVIAATAGNNQTTPVNNAYATALQATVKDVIGNPISGAAVTFTSNSNFATFSGGSGIATATTNASGVATAPTLTAAGFVGQFSVSAAVSGVPTAASFALTNACPVSVPTTVTNLNDNGAGSLRMALCAPADSTISFQSGLSGTIILSGGQLTITKNLTITGPGASNLAISGNNTSRVFEIATNGTVSISGLTIKNGNTASGGGGLANTSGGTLNLSASVVTGNTATGGSGGGGVLNKASLNIDQSTISKNASTGGSFGTGCGGGLDNLGYAKITNSTFSGNTASGANSIINGGGICNNYGADISIVGSTIAGNSTDSTGNGGGIAAAGTLVLRNSTIANNQAFSGAGLAVGLANAGSFSASTSFTVINTIVAGNGARNDVSGTVTSGGHNLIGDSTGSFGFGSNGDVVLSGQFSTTAFPLTNNGGPTQTILPLALPFIGAGDPNPLGLPSTDQRGFPRVINGQIDIGAVQFQGYSLAASGGTPQSTLLSAAFATPLQATVTEKTSNVPLSGVAVTYTAPSTGPSATFSPATSANTNASGVASVTATANSSSGIYAATASVGSASTSFALDNLQTQAITFNALSNVTYGAAAFTISATASSVLPVSFSSTTTSVCTVSGNTVSIAAAGSCSIVAIQGGNTNFVAAQNVTRTFLVNKASLTVTASGATRTYGAANALSYSFSGFVNGDSSAVISGAPSLFSTASAASSPATYEVTATQGTLTAANYNFVFAAGSLTVTQATTEIFVSLSPSSVASAGQSFTVNFMFTAPPPGAATPSGVVSYSVDGGASQTATISANGTATATFSGLAVGVHKITNSYGGDANYQGTSVRTLTLTVTAQSTLLTLTVSPGTSLQIGQAFNLTFNLTGSPSPTGAIAYTVDSGTPQSATLAAGKATATLSGLAVGPHSITYSYAGDSTYGAVAAQTATLTVTVPPASLSVSPTTLQFSDSAPTGQMILVTNTGGGGAIGFTVAPTTVTGGAWLLAPTSSGTTPGSVDVLISASVVATLAPGSYTGAIAINPQTGAGTTVQVTLTIGPKPAGFMAAPATILLGAPEGGNNRVTETFTLTTPVNAAVGFNISAATVSGGNWLTVTPSSGVTPATITVLAVTIVGGTHLPKGGYNGRVTITPVASSGYTGSLTVEVGLAIAAPGIIPGGVVSGAIYSTAVSAGSIISLYGLNLATDTASATSVPLPKTLAGTQVLVNGTAVPLFYVSPLQINAQLPIGISGTVTITVVSAGTTGVTTTVQVAKESPAIFTTTGTQGAILNFDQSPNSPANPAAAGSTIVIYATGLGPTNPPLTDGQAGASRPPFNAVADPLTVSIGGQNAAVSFAAVAPGFVGLFQINATIPATVLAGKAVPVQIAVSGLQSNTVTMAVKSADIQ